MKHQPNKSKPATNPNFALPLILTGCYLVSFVSAEASFNGLRDWYPGLIKPSWNPPAFIFAPVWTVLYGLMGFAAWTIWKLPRSHERTWALRAFNFQLLLNGAWSMIFFAAHNFAAATCEISVMWLAIGLTVILFWRLSPKAGGVLLPYLIWVSFAATLCATIWKLNA